MDSINKNQPEQNHEDLFRADAISKIKELVDKANSCFFCTNPIGESIGTRPMSVQKIDDTGAIWFLSPNDSHKNADINSSNDVKLYFRGSTHSDFLYLQGRATITTDKAIIKELWEPLLKAWFTEGENDPRISAIKVTPTAGYYWDTKHGNAVAFLKTIVGAMTGTTLDDSIEGSLKV